MLRSVCFSSSLALAAGLASPACTDTAADLGDEVTLSEERQEVFQFGGLSNFLQVKRGNLCMVAPASGIGPVTQAPCLSTSTHWWKVMPAPSDPGYFTLENNHRCLDVPSSSTAVGEDLQVYPCNRSGQSNQHFRLTRIGGVPPGEWKVQPKLGVQHNLCLDIEGGGTNTGARLQQYTCKTTDVDNQRFLMSPYSSYITEHFMEDCNQEDPLTLQWFELGTRNRITLFYGDLGYFPARGFTWGCDSEPDETFNCPAGTSWIEVRRLDGDEFRIKCTL